LFYLADDGIADAFTSHSFWLSGKTTLQTLALFITEANRLAVSPTLKSRLL